MNKFIKVDLIKSYLSANNLTNAEFCKLCNISASSLERILDDNLKVDLHDIFNISRVLGVSLYELFYGK